MSSTPDFVASDLRLVTQRVGNDEVRYTMVPAAVLRYASMKALESAVRKRRGGDETDKGVDDGGIAFAIRRWFERRTGRNSNVSGAQEMRLFDPVSADLAAWHTMSMLELAARACLDRASDHNGVIAVPSRDWAHIQNFAPRLQTLPLDIGASSSLDKLR